MLCSATFLVNPAARKFKKARRSQHDGTRSIDKVISHDFHTSITLYSCADAEIFDWLETGNNNESDSAHRRQRKCQEYRRKITELFVENSFTVNTHDAVVWYTESGLISSLSCSRIMTSEPQEWTYATWNIRLVYHTWQCLLLPP